MSLPEGSEVAREPLFWLLSMSGNVFIVLEPNLVHVLLLYCVAVNVWNCICYFGA